MPRDRNTFQPELSNQMKTVLESLTSIFLCILCTGMIATWGSKIVYSQNGKRESTKYDYGTRLPCRPNVVSVPTLPMSTADSDNVYHYEARETLCLGGKISVKQAKLT